MENYTFKDSFLGGYNKKEVEDYMSRLQSEMDTERARFRSIEEENKNLLEQRKEIETHYRDLWQQYEEASAENEKLNLKVQLHDKETENFQVQIKKLNDANNFLRKQLVKGQTGQDDDMEYRSAGSVPYERREAGYQTELLRTASAGYRDGGAYDREQGAGVHRDTAAQEREALSPRSQAYVPAQETPAAYTHQEIPEDMSSAQPQDTASAYAQPMSPRETAAAYTSPVPQRETSSAYTQQTPQREASSAYTQQMPQREAASAYTPQMPQREAVSAYAQQVPQREAAPAYTQPAPQREAASAYTQQSPQREAASVYTQQVPQREASAAYVQQLPRQDAPFAHTAQTEPHDAGSSQTQQAVPDDAPLPFAQQASARDAGPAYAREAGIRADAEFSAENMPMRDDLGEDLNTYMDSAAAGLRQQTREMQEKASAFARTAETAAEEAADDFPLQVPPVHKRPEGKSSGSKYMKQLREIAKKVNVKL